MKGQASVHEISSIQNKFMINTAKPVSKLYTLAVFLCKA